VVQIKTFKSPNLKKLEDEVNLWLQSQGDRIKVLNVNSGTLELTENMYTTMHYTSTVSYEVKKEKEIKILHG
jgi:hypothetical protein